MYEDYWRPWDEDKKAVWVRQKPERAMTLHEFPFYTTDMWDYDFQMEFAQWLHKNKKATDRRDLDCPPHIHFGRCYYTRV